MLGVTDLLYSCAGRCKKTHTLTQTGRQKLSQPVKEVKISLRAKGEGQMKEESISSPPQCDISSSFTECLLSISLKQLVRGIFSFTLFLSFPFCHSFSSTPLHSQSLVQTSLPSSRCPFIRTLVNFFPSLLSSAHQPIPSALFLTFVVSFSLSFSLSSSPPVILHHITLQLVYIPQP